MTQRHGHDEQLEGELVVGPEEGDDEVLRPGRLEVDDDLADRRDERRRARAGVPASSSETPSAVATATIPATAAGQSRWVRGRTSGSCWSRSRWSVLTGASSRFGVTFACRGSSAPVLAARHARPGPPVAPLHGDRQVEGAAQDLVAQDGLRAARPRRRPHRPAPGRAEARRDLLDVMRDEHDGRRSRGRGKRRRGRR